MGKAENGNHRSVSMKGKNNFFFRFLASESADEEKILMIKMMSWLSIRSLNTDCSFWP